MAFMRAHGDITLGILAGGRATRLGGTDKAWAVYRGETLIERTLHALGEEFSARLISANRDPERYTRLGMRAVADRVPGFSGPLAGLDALLSICATPLLFTVPVDLRVIPRDLLTRLLAEGEGGAAAQDTNGLQSLIALWPANRARSVVRQALTQGEGAVHRIVAELALHVAHFDGADFGNLNAPEDFLT